jgi:predicted dithiol-disulfide oxidoreductase (DUF899 family)
MTMGDRREPQLWPDGTSDEYVKARLALLEQEKALRDHAEQVAAARRDLPPGRLLDDYTLEEGPRELDLDEPVRRTRLVDVLGSRDTLVTYHLMYAPDDEAACPMCSMWVDGFHGVSHHLAQHVAFAVVARAPLQRLRAWGRVRGWDGLRLLSSYHSTFSADLELEDPDGSQRPAIAVFVRDGDRVRHSYSMQAMFSTTESERGIDLLSPVWQVLDLLPSGRGDWYASNGYAGRTRGG